MADAQAVQTALDTLSRPGDKAAFASANTWLQDFQHSVNTSRPWSRRHSRLIHSTSE